MVYHDETGLLASLDDQFKFQSLIEFLPLFFYFLFF